MASVEVEIAARKYSVACRDGLGLQVFIEHDKDAGRTCIAGCAQIRPIRHFPVRRKLGHDLPDGPFEVVRRHVRQNHAVTIECLSMLAQRALDRLFG